MKNTWDDFGYKTSYDLYYQGPAFRGLIGGLKILSRGQTKSAENLFQEGLMGPLDERFVSLGVSLDYYQRLSELPDSERIRASPDLIESGFPNQR